MSPAGGIKRAIDATKAHILVVQETKLTKAGIVEANAALLKRNWKMAASPSSIQRHWAEWRHN